jgi:mersacidin/lichenicidin family type 2 lantibiotic
VKRKEILMNSNIVRAWKAEFSRQGLSEEEHAQLSENPAGELALTDAELGSVFAAGGYDNNHTSSSQCGDNRFNAGGCDTQVTYQCVHPQFGYGWDDCKRYRYESCHHTRYSRRDDCRNYGEQR